VDYFYHHLFPSDNTAIKLISELGLEKKFFFEEPKTSILFQNQISQFDSPLSLLTFPHLSLPQKIRTGIVTAYLKLSNSWQGLEKITATQWLKKSYGEKVYQVIWEPLLKAKFGEFYNQIPASWFWARIQKRSTKLGYIEGSFQTLIDKLVEKIKQNNGQIFFNHEIKNSNELIHWSKFDRIIFTTPVSVFLKILKNTSKVGFDSFEVEKLEKLKMIGALNLVLTLKESFLTDGTYWLNVNDNSFPFVAVVEHTNFIDKSHYGNHSILYVGGYYPQNHRYFKMKKEEILKEWTPYLQKINPDFHFSRYVMRYTLYANQFAQPIVPLNYSGIIPPHQTPAKNIFLANMQQVYPWDRGVNYAIEIGEKIAKLIG
jgi:protoporphyrinogen oxidase